MFPPRYAGMEGKRCMGGWHRVGSPALRGDGRKRRAPLTSKMRFPPRYAGMEGEPGVDQ